MKKLTFLIGHLLLATAVFAAEDSVYDFSWLDKDKSVYVLQNRKFRKSGRVYLSAMGGTALSGTFVDSTTLQGRAGYFWSENWGIELVFAKNSPSQNDTYKTLKGNGAGVIGFFNAVDAYTGGMLMWSPFYAKINTFNSILYFDWLFGIGYATIDTVDNRIETAPAVTNGALTPDSASGLLLNVGMRFYMNDSWSFRVDLTPVLYNGFSRESNTTNDGEELYSHWDFTVGLNLAF